MTPEIQDWWERAQLTLGTARDVADRDPHSAASRAYYAAFYAVTALFALEGQSFRKHTALEAAVHRDLVKPGRWSSELGAAFSDLAKMRATADYGSLIHISVEDAKSAVESAERIVSEVREMRPEFAANAPP